MSSRPHDTAFKQQRLKAWQPILTPKWVIGTFLCVGIVFVPIGIALTVASNGVFVSSVLYDAKSGVTEVSSNCTITSNNQGYNTIVSENSRDGSNCEIEFEITQNIPVDTDLNLYYQLENFYQNHRQYVKSRYDQQMRNKVTPSYNDKGEVQGAYKELCQPTNATFYDENDQIMWFPCGLISTSYFNDAFFVSSYNGLSEEVTINKQKVDIDDSNIAWSTDLDQKFYNPTGSNSKNFQSYAYVWQLYDQMSCYKPNGDRVFQENCESWTDVVNVGQNITASDYVLGNGCVRCPAGSAPRFEGGIPAPYVGEDPIPPATYMADGPMTQQKSNGGIRDEHFVVWMRTAGLPKFRKLYGKITPPVEGFKKGDKLRIRVVPNFEVASFEGRKSLVLATSSGLGGQSFLGVAYIVVGMICVFLALAFYLKHKFAPRRLGDVRFIAWRHVQTTNN